MAKTLTEFYQSEIEFQEAQKAHAEHEIREIKRCSDLKVRALYKEIDQINLVLNELQKLYDREREDIKKYAATKPENL